MPFVDTPLTDAILATVADAWSIETGAPGVRLHGGEDSAAFRLNSVVVRVGPTWRTTDELEWCHAVARAAAEHIPEALAPLPAADGVTVVRVDDRPVSVWPFVEGSWADDDDEAQWLEAADLLARLHRALAEVAPRVGPRPSPSRPDGGMPDINDPDLDVWLAAFDARFRAAQPLHGDFYAGNMLAGDGHIVALLDWDEAFLGPPERELAWAAWEFGDGLWADSLDQAHAFMAAYHAAGGPAVPIGDDELRQLVRQRLRFELAYVARTQALGPSLGADDLEYHARQVTMFEQLKPPT